MSYYHHGGKHLVLLEALRGRRAQVKFEVVAIKLKLQRRSVQSDVLSVKEIKTAFTTETTTAVKTSKGAGEYLYPLVLFSHEASHQGAGQFHTQLIVEKLPTNSLITQYEWKLCLKSSCPRRSIN